MSMDAVLYIHGMGGSAAESAHYEPLFPGCRTTGLDYSGSTPWEAGAEIREEITKLKSGYDNITLVANSIGAYFSLHAGIGGLIRKAYFISPVTDMERLILERMKTAGITEDELREKGRVPADGGPDLEWEYLRWVREHPVRWEAPTRILYGSADALIPPETVERVAAEHGAVLAVMEGGEHWFHTEEQMRFLDRWIRSDRS